MDHDYAHCWDYEKGVCPEDCFRAKLTDDLKNWPYPVAYSKFKETEACPLTHPQQKPTNADRFRAMTDEELVEIFANNDCGYCRIHDFCFAKGSAINCEDVWLDWLKEEAETDG